MLKIWIMEKMETLIKKVKSKRRIFKISKAFISLTSGFTNRKDSPKLPQNYLNFTKKLYRQLLRTLPQKTKLFLVCYHTISSSKAFNVCSLKAYQTLNKLISQF